MRIWHESLIPLLCRQHLLAMWREGLGCYKIVTGQVDGGSYKNHPATKEFINAPYELMYRLFLVREEMIKRGYHPKEVKGVCSLAGINNDVTSEWQSLDEQITILKAKGCQCSI